MAAMAERVCRFTPNPLQGFRVCEEVVLDTISPAFDPWPAFLGGMMMGFIALLRLCFYGKLTGLQIYWKVVGLKVDYDAFVPGMVVGGIAISVLAPQYLEYLPAVVGVGFGRSLVAGFLIGFGSCLGGGW